MPERLPKGSIVSDDSVTRLSEARELIDVARACDNVALLVRPNMSDEEVRAIQNALAYRSLRLRWCVRTFHGVLED